MLIHYYGMLLLMVGKSYIIASIAIVRVAQLAVALTRLGKPRSLI